MFKNKIILIVILLVGLIAISTVNAEEISNETTDLATEEVDDSTIESKSSFEITKQYPVNGMNDTVVNEGNGDENVSIVDTDNAECNDVLGFSTSKFNANVANCALNYGDRGVIYIYLNFPSGYVLKPDSYSYDFYIKISDENGKLLMTSEEYSGSAKSPITLMWFINSVEIDKSKNHNNKKYTIDLVSSNEVKASSVLYITHNSKYNVNVSLKDNIIKKGGSTEITMTVTQYNDEVFNYDFYLIIYDSNFDVKIKKRYHDSNCSEITTLSYIIKPNDLPVDSYYIRINGADYTCESDKLQVLGDVNLGYVVYLDDYYIDFVKNPVIKLNVFQDKKNPASYYSFLLNIYDSKNYLVCQEFCRGSQWGTVSINIDTTKLMVGNYTIKVKSGDSILNTARLIVTNSLNYDYILSVSDTTVKFGDNGDIVMKIAPAYSGNYTYDFYFIVYDSNFNQIINERYTNNSVSTSYEIYKFYPVSLKSGNYTVNLRGINGNYQNIFSKLIVESKRSTYFAVNIVSDVIINPNGKGQVVVQVSNIKANFYDFYLKIYDAKNREKISRHIKKVDVYGSYTEYCSIDPNLEPGIYTIKIIDTAGNFVMDAAKLTIMALSYSDYSVSVSDTVISYSGFKCISMSISPASAGYYLYDFYLKVYDSNDVEKISERYYGSTAKYNIDYFPEYDELEPESYTIKIFNNGDNHVMDTAKLTVQSSPYYSYSVNITDINLNYGSNESIKISISYSQKRSYFSTYDFYLKIYDSNNVEKISKRFYNNKFVYSESFYIDSTSLGVGKYGVVILNCNENHIMATANLTINKQNSKVNIKSFDVIKYYKGSERFVTTLFDDNNKTINNVTVKITINGNTYSRITDGAGQASIALGLNSGKYSVTTEYNGSKVYSTVTIKDTVISSDFSKIYKNGTQYYGTFVDSQGNLLKNTDVQFNINGVFYTRKTNDTGVARMNINLNAGQYVLTATNPSTGEQHATTITVLPNIIENNDLTKYYKNSSQYSVRLLDDAGKPVGKGVSVTFNINGVFYTRTTNESGYAKININLEAGEYIITSEYKGYRESNKIKVLPVLSASDLYMSYRDGSKFTAKLVNGQGKAYANQNVTFNINGVFYQRLTDENGTAKLNINLMAGKYIITSSFNGCNIANEVLINSAGEFYYGRG